MDETGFRIGGKTQWLLVASTACLTFYRVCTRRGSLLANVVGIAVHDHWKPYYTMSGVLQCPVQRPSLARTHFEKEDWARNSCCAAAVTPPTSHASAAALSSPA
jgi:transposase